MTTQHAELPQALHVAVLACQVAQDERNAAFARLIRSHDRAEQSRLNQAHDQATKAAEAAFAALQRTIAAEGGYGVWRIVHDRHHHSVVRPTRDSKARRAALARLQVVRQANLTGAKAVYVWALPTSLVETTRPSQLTPQHVIVSRVTYDAGRYGTWDAVAYGVLPESDRAFHDRIAAMDDQAAALAELDARYHDHLAEGANCHLCGIEHAAVNPEASRPARPQEGFRSQARYDAILAEGRCQVAYGPGFAWTCDLAKGHQGQHEAPEGDGLARVTWSNPRQEAPQGATTAQDARTAPDLTDWAPGETTEVYGR